MTDFTTFSRFSSSIQACAARILDVEDKALDSSLLGLFKKRDHAGFMQILDQITLDLKKLKVQVSSQNPPVMKSQNLQGYIDALIGFNETLWKICSGLNDKNMGQPYSMSLYQASLNLLEKQKSACSLAQANLLK